MPPNVWQEREVPQIAAFSAQNSGGGQASRNFRVYLAYEWRIFPLDACYLAYRWRMVLPHET